MSNMTLDRFWQIIHQAENDPAKLQPLLNTLSRRELWLFNEIFRLEHHGILHGTQRSQLTPKYADDLNPFAELVHRTFVERCFSADEKGIAAYPDAVITDWTWDIIHRAEKDSGKLRTILMELSKEEIHRFYDEFNMAASALDDERFRPPPELAHSEDGMLDLSHWIVTQGKDYYLSVWENPATFPHELDPRDFFYGEAEDVFEEKFGEDLWYFNPFTGDFIR